MSQSKRSLQADDEKSDTSNSENEEEFMDDDINKIFKNLRNPNVKGKFQLYCKYLNVLLLKKGDPFVSKMYEKYLSLKR